VYRSGQGLLTISTICFRPTICFAMLSRRRTNAAYSSDRYVFRINRAFLAWKCRMERSSLFADRNPCACHRFYVTTKSRQACNPFSLVVNGPRSGTRNTAAAVLILWSSAGRLSFTCGCRLFRFKTGSAHGGPLYLKLLNRGLNDPTPPNYRANARFWVGAKWPSICCH